MTTIRCRILSRVTLELRQCHNGFSVTIGWLRSISFARVTQYIISKAVRLPLLSYNILCYYKFKYIIVLFILLYKWLLNIKIFFRRWCYYCYNKHSTLQSGIQFNSRVQRHLSWYLRSWNACLRGIFVNFLNFLSLKCTHARREKLLLHYEI